MDKIIALVFGMLLLVSCGGEEAGSDESTDGSESVEADVDSSMTDSVAEDALEIGSSGWQINDYAEHFMEAEIKLSSEDMDYEAGDMWFYETLDVKGGYAAVTGAVEGSIIFAMWRMENGNDLIGRTAASCGPVCDYSYEFYEQNGEEGEVATNTLLPMGEIEEHRKKIHDQLNERYEYEYEEDCQIYFELPKKGTSMYVHISAGANEHEFRLAKLKWDKKKFSIEEKYEIPYAEED